MNWTDEQKRIIDLRDSNILVSAAAGSGKTAVLVERIIRLIKDENKNVDEFLVVTFTNAAAADMRQKIQKALLEEASKGKNVRHIRKQLSLLNKAYIMTLHSFCMDIVRNNFHLVGLDPNFRLGDTSETQILFTEALDEVLENQYKEESKAFKILVESLGENRGDVEVTKIITSVYNFMTSFPDPYKWLKKSVAMASMTEEEFKDSVWYDEIMDYIGKEISGARSNIDLAMEIAQEADGPHKYEETLEKDIKVLDGLLEASEKGLEASIEAIYNFKAPRLAPMKKEEVENADKQKEVQDLRKDYRDIIGSLESNLPYKDITSYVSDINYMYKPLKALKAIIMELNETYREKKHSRSLIDFNDLQYYALDILMEDIGGAYRDKIKYIFIDEYQDTNSLQETIVDQIKRSSNLFMVGDIKQSIYRFRLADPSIFNEKYKTYTKDSEGLKDSIIHRVIELNKNFRSREEVLEATNFVFSRIMTPDLGEVDYNENVRLHTGNHEFQNKEPVEVNFIEMTGEEDLDEELEGLKAAEADALFIARRIEKLLGEKTFDSEIEDQLRDIEYRDIVILSRSVKEPSMVFDEVFARKAIPFYFEGGGGYFDTIEVEVMLSLLKLLDNTRQDIPLISLMRSPIGKFTTEELVEIRSRSKDGSFVDACRSYEASSLKNKIDSFFQSIKNWRERSRYTPLNDLIWEILMETNYYYFVGSLAHGEARQANLRLLADKAYEFENTSMKGLFKFLVYIEKLRESEQDNTSTAKILGENDNVVRLMSIHKSKGLEFPIVIVSGLNKGFNLMDTRPKVLLDKDYGIGSKFIDIENRIEKNTINRLAITEKIKRENLSEEMRILYVAMTRAVDRLILVGSVKDLDREYKKWRKGYSQYFLYKGNSYMDWLGASLFAGKASDDIDRILESGKHKDWLVNKAYLGDILEVEEKKEVLNVSQRLEEFKKGVKLEDYKPVEEKLCYSYSYEESINIPGKLSVTAIKNLDSERFKSLKYNRPEIKPILDYDSKSGDLKKKGFTGAEEGSLVHLVMEKIELKKDIDLQELESQLESMTARNLLKPEEAEFIKENYMDRILDFFQSSLGRRMLKSQRVEREAPFVMKKGTHEILEGLNNEDFVLVQGIIDCYFEEDGEVVIVDFKTDNLISNTIEDIKEEYRDQILSYKEAIEKTMNKKVKEAYIYLLTSGVTMLIE